MEDTVEPKVKRYPLWEHCLEEMHKEESVFYGSKIETKWFVEKLGCEPNTIEFGGAISAINDEIISDGYYLSARDQGGLFYVIVDPERAECVADAKMRNSFRQAHRSLKLLNGLLSNPSANLISETRRRIESKAEKTALRIILSQRASAIKKIVETHSPKTLKP